MFYDLYYLFRPPRYVVKPDVRSVIGRFSKRKRQIDVAVYDARNDRTPKLTVECKRYKRRLNIKDVEQFIGMLGDIGAERGVLVTPIGFSSGALNRAKAANLIAHTLPAEDAVRLNWREVVRTFFPWDEIFQPAMGDAYYALDTTSDVDDCIDSLEELPFEEWDSVLSHFLTRNQAKGALILRHIAQFHPDDGWRYNAIRLLDDHGFLDTVFRDILLARVWRAPFNSMKDCSIEEPSLDNEMRTTQQASRGGTRRGLKPADKSSASANHKAVDRPVLCPMLTRGTCV